MSPRVPYRNIKGENDTYLDTGKILSGSSAKRKRLDSTDYAIISMLMRNARIAASEMAKELKNKNISLTERAIRKRIKKLEKENVINGYSIVADDELTGKRVARMILVRFRNNSKFAARLERYKKYVLESPYCVCAARTRGDLDWIHIKSFPTKELADIEDDVFRTLFGDMMQDYRSYDLEIIKKDFNVALTEKDVINVLRKHNSKIALPE